MLDFFSFSKIFRHNNFFTNTSNLRDCKHTNIYQNLPQKNLPQNIHMILGSNYFSFSFEAEHTGRLNYQTKPDEHIHMHIDDICLFVWLVGYFTAYQLLLDCLMENSFQAMM